MQLPVIPEEFKTLAHQLVAIGYIAGFSASGETIQAENHSAQNIKEDAEEFTVIALNGDWAKRNKHATRCN